MENVISFEEFVFTIPRDPFLSPYFAPDNMLANIPPIKILVLVTIFFLDFCYNLIKHNVL